jgi:hypothetical protein
MHVERAACRCTAAVCGHPNGEPCGKLVENPIPIRDVDREGRQGLEFPSGLCEECWNNVMPGRQT